MPALAIMLGANIGTTLIVQVLSFDVTVVFPVLIALGVFAFRRGQGTRFQDLGRVAIGTRPDAAFAAPPRRDDRAERELGDGAHACSPRSRASRS